LQPRSRVTLLVRAAGDLAGQGRGWVQGGVHGQIRIACPWMAPWAGSWPWPCMEEEGVKFSSNNLEVQAPLYMCALGKASNRVGAVAQLPSCSSPAAQPVCGEYLWAQEYSRSGRRGQQALVEQLRCSATRAQWSCRQVRLTWPSSPYGAAAGCVHRVLLDLLLCSPPSHPTPSHVWVELPVNCVSR
jgi:hypothetical protein